MVDHHDLGGNFGQALAGLGQSLGGVGDEVVAFRLAGSLG